MTYSRSLPVCTCGILVLDPMRTEHFRLPSPLTKRVAPWPRVPALSLDLRMHALRAPATTFVCLLLFTASLGAQLPDSANAKRSGVYRTSADLLAGRLEFGIDCGKAQHRINRHTVLDRPYVDVTHDGIDTRLLKSEIFAYRECDGLLVRFVEGREYTVLAVGNIALYVRPVMVSVGKGARAEAAYYFSRTVADSIAPLTRAALKAAFPEQHTFHDRLDALIRSDAELAVYDTTHRTYRVLYISESLAGQKPAVR